MPKRSCPFDDDDLPPQLKIHIGEKEVDNGVYKDERMKKVYDKTLNLLMEGSKTLSKNLTPSLEMSPIDLQPSNVLSNKIKENPNSKQMVLNCNLQLQVTDKLKSHVPTDVCGCCRIIDKNVLTKCYYCDQILCSLCLSECIKCQETYCQNCFFTMYGKEEYSICLSCYQ